ncbi:DUF7344 domain-containing protein [Halalkalicoccus salilacus]|uniref:DUF7344 domain-containing protein n=3 Tax=Halalkalicoccus TaxID=332246 RepID=UPI002F96DA4F
MMGRRGSDPAVLEGDPEPDGRPPSGSADGHDSLAYPRRRHVLDRLLAHGGRMELSELADEIAAVEHTATDEVPNGQAKLVRLDLHHSHVPKLVNAGVLEYESESGLIELDDADRAKRLLEAWDDAHERRSP